MYEKVQGYPSGGSPLGLASGYGQEGARTEQPTLRGLHGRLGDLHKMADEMLNLVGEFGGHEAQVEPRELHPVPNGLVGELHQSVAVLYSKFSAARDKFVRVHG